MVFNFGAAVVGSLSGIGISLAANFTRKVPLSRMPWNHVGCLFAGFFIGDQWVKLEQRLLDECNQLRMDNGLPPFVGVDGWLPARTPETNDMSKTQAPKEYRQPASD